MINLANFLIRQAAVGERHSPGGSGQPCCPGQQRLPQKLGQDHSRYLPYWTQPLQGHATRFVGYLLSVSIHIDVRCFNNQLQVCNKFVLLISPSGDHKKRAKYRFASKTLMRILPDSFKKEV